MNELKMFRVEQLFHQPHINEVEVHVRRELEKLGLPDLQGKRVAIMAGSRGIPKIRRILRAIVAYLEECKAVPFVVPCMGSHGGGTAEGQVKILAKLSITEETMGCPIDGTMDEVEIGKEPESGQPVYFSRNLAEADYVLPVNRLKAHTLFCGEIESGLCKMLAVGGGRKRGAETVHELSETVGLERAVVSSAEQILAHCNVLCGIALIDNAYHRTAHLRAVPAESPESFIAKEKELLQLAHKMLAQIPFADVDVLWLREMGKNVSGSGSDPNVIGRKPGGWRRDALPRVGQATIGHVCVSSLTAESQGNAGALRLHDAVTERLLNQIDQEATRLNAEVSGATDVVYPPACYQNDQAMLHAAMFAARTQIDEPRVVFARNTMDLRTLYVSESLRAEVEESKNIRVLAEPAPVRFTAGGELDVHFEVHLEDYEDE